VLAILVATLVAHGLGLRNGFALDDEIAVLTHPVVTGTAPLRDLFRLTNWGQPLPPDLTGFRPLTTFTFWLEHGRPPSPLLMHLSSLAWSLASAILLWRLGRRIVGPTAAIVGAVLFASAAIHVDAIAAIANRGELIATTLGFAALLCVAPEAGWWRALAAATLYAGALTAKESAFPLVGVAAWLVLCMPDWRRSRGSRRAAAAMVAVAAAFLLLKARPGASGLDGMLGAGAGLRTAASDPGTPDNPVMALPRLERLPTALALGGRYLQNAAVPARLGHDYTYSVILPARWSEAGTLAGLALIAAAVALLVHDLHRGGGGVAALLGALLGSLLFLSHLIVPLSVVFADRLFYAGSAWLFLLAGLVVERAARASRGLAAAALAVALGVQVTFATLQTLAWHDDVRLNDRCVDVTPENVRCHYYLARALTTRGRPVPATWHYAMAALGRQAFPAPWDARLERELGHLPRSERLARLPAALGGGEQASAWLRALADFLVRSGATAEAEIVRALIPP
jgi:hypothetical protein